MHSLETIIQRNDHATLEGLREWLATPDFVATVDSGIVAEWVAVLDEVLARR